MSQRAIVFRRLWAIPAASLELAQFDNHPHHELAAVLEQYAVKKVIALHGSLDNWDRAVAEQIHEKEVELSCRGAPDGPVRSVEQCLKAVNKDDRPLLLRLIFDSDVLQGRRGGGLFLPGRDVSPLDELVTAPQYLLECGSIEDGRMVAAHL